MKLVKILLLILLFFPSNIYTNEPPKEISGKELREWVKINYYNNKRVYLTYNEARIFMYGFIDNDNGTITCVYSGFNLELPYGTKTTFPDPINCEHTVPQSYFKEAREDKMMKTDLHHLYPVLKRWNSTRSNHPYREIDDTDTKKWMVGDLEPLKSIPREDIDAYSEYYNRGFEPREDHKGNIARAIFYFYTVYEGDDITPLEVLIDLDTLFYWHQIDPVDRDEIERNNLIEIYQGNRNPYIDNPELAYKVFNIK